MASDPTSHFGPIKIESLTPQHVAVCQVISESPEEDAAKVMRDWLAGQGLEELTRRPNFGFDVEVTPEQQEAGLRGYEVWYPVPETAQAFPPITIQDYTGGLYAVMRLSNPFADPFAVIPAGWQHIVAWGESNDRYEMAAHPCLERLIPDPDGPHLDLYLAVAEKRA